MIKTFFAAFVILVIAIPFGLAVAQPFGFRPNYEIERLSQRVAELERLVEQMERHIDQLADRIMQLHPNSTPVFERVWTCRLRSAFSKVYVATAETRGQAMAEVLKECAEDSSARFCKDSAVQCEQ